MLVDVLMRAMSASLSILCSKQREIGQRKYTQRACGGEKITLDMINVSLEHRYICINSQQYIVWVKIMHFYFMPKIIRY